MITKSESLFAWLHVYMYIIMRNQVLFIRVRVYPIKAESKLSVTITPNLRTKLSYDPIISSNFATYSEGL